MTAYIRQIYGTYFPWQARQAVTVWCKRLRDRRALAQLDDHLLRDIGLSHGDRQREVSKPFWRG